MDRILGIAELSLMVEQSVVHQPELALEAGRLRRFRGRLGMGVDLRLGIVPEGKTEVVPELAVQLADRSDHIAAVRRLVVPVLDQGMAGRKRADDVVTIFQR